MSCGNVQFGGTGSPSRGRRFGGWAQLNVHPEALRNWVGQAEADTGERHDRPTTQMLAEDAPRARENAELRRVSEVLRAASADFASEVGPPGGGHELHREHHQGP